MPNRDDINTESEVRKMYSALDNHEESVASPAIEKPEFKNKKSKKVLLYFVFFAFIAGSALSLWFWFSDCSNDYIKLVWLILLLVGYLVLFSIQMMEVYATRGETLKFFKNSNKLVFEGLLETIDADCLLASDPGKYSTDALQLADLPTKYN